MTMMTRVAAVAAVIAMAAFIGFQFSNLPDSLGASPTPIPVPSADPSTSSAPSAAPESAEPSAEPSAASLVVRLLGGGEAGRVHLVTILDDGRVISSDPFGASPPVERRLTAEGIQLVRDELDATGLTETSADYLPVPNPGAEPPAYGGAGPSLEIGQPGGGTAIITWFLFGDTEEDWFQPQPEAEALEALATRLSALEEWLPAAAWAVQTGVPYVAEGYRVYVYSQQWGGSPEDLPVETTSVSWPLIDGVDVYGDVVAEVAEVTGDGDTPPRCRIVSDAESASVIGTLEAAGATLSEGSIFPGASYTLGYRAGSREVRITFEPILPHADASCGSEETF